MQTRRVSGCGLVFGFLPPGFSGARGGACNSVRISPAGICATERTQAVPIFRASRPDDSAVARSRLLTSWASIRNAARSSPALRSHSAHLKSSGNGIDLTRPKSRHTKGNDGRRENEEQHRHWQSVGHS
jgi:hypothetical protein